MRTSELKQDRCVSPSVSRATRDAALPISWLKPNRAVRFFVVVFFTVYLILQFFLQLSSRWAIDRRSEFLVSYALVHLIGEIAQLVERRTHKPKVKGSIPFLATTISLERN